ncbi:gliding motility-associated C-terminal domain-containing protein [Fulvivirga ligni]|uniref:T9SS type B sorting domain-containing protein n=1 Tax=Fulvivirga ligni TaxID=2904246 RepID=UPI001F37E260|nr:gliding motility-associated C-terminal domain-containing protein [Fulvivirga ligni]UII19368.1 gliding motility-associated C-terminal domain-containing protein [Fulvivirga ligni]
MKNLVLLLSFLLIVGASKAQEICDNGIDDDGDGFIDCYDPDCVNFGSCDGFFLGNDASCEAVPDSLPAFTMEIDFTSQNETANHLGRIAIGDLDRDGIPEIISQNKYNDRLYILNGNDGSIKYQTTVSGGAYPEWRVAIANVEDDDCAEIFVVLAEWFPSGGGYGDTDYYIASYDCQLNEIWRSERLENDPIHLSLADFDGDGQVELFYKDEVRDARTGTRIVKGNDNDWNKVNGGPVAIDILGDEDLEFVSANKIYSVNLGSRTTDSGSLTELKSFSNYKTKTQFSSTSTADYNQDGFLDVIISGVNTNDYTTTVFFWDVHNDNLTTFNDPIPTVPNSTLKCSSQAPNTDDYKNGWINGTGRLNIGDLDGDGELNVSFVSGRFLYALDENFNQKWRVEVNEETSGYTGCTLFDFNGDGQMEIVYRDEQWIYIIKGDDGSVFTQRQCISRTNVEYPIVADVDADGSTELCVVCGTDDINAWDNFCDLGYSRNSQVRVYKSASEPWVPARRLWNQHGYFNVNVNDDLSIPRRQQKHHLVWSDGTCTQGPNRPLNNFLNQSPFLSSQGCPVYASPDIAFTGDITIDQPTCPSLDFTTSFQITNLGDVPFSGNLPISFYSADPLQPGASKLATLYFSINQLKNGDVIDMTNVAITGIPGMENLFIALNDAGTTIPTPISFPNTPFLECDYDNVRSAPFAPLPFQLSAVPTNNIQCAGNTVPANGSARAFRLVGTTEVIANYDFFWFNGTDVSGTPAYVGAVYSGLSAGTYSVYATHKTAQCSSDVVQVTVVDEAFSFDVQVTEIKGDENCTNPNGHLRVIPNGGDAYGKYTYEWLEGDITSTDVVSTSHDATGLKGGTNYTVIVTHKATGCSSIGSGTVTDMVVLPVVSASATDISCSDANAGTVTANVEGSTGGYTFEWYNGPNVLPTPSATGNSLNNLPAGDYTVVATRNSTGCQSLPSTVTVNQTTPPTASVNKLSDNISCDENNPMGSAAASGNGGSGTYTYEWFEGQNTSTAVIRTAATVTDFPKGIYTVKVTDTNGCSDTAEVIIDNDRTIPTLTANTTDVTQCNPFNGSITVSVSAGNVSDYTFFYYEGSSVKSTPDFAETSNQLSGLMAGTYTVQAQNNITSCTASNPISVIINAPVIAITLNKSITTFPSNCESDASAASDGVLAINVSPSSSDYYVTWYQGAIDPSTTSDSPILEGVNEYVASSLNSDNYTVVVRNLTTGCEEITSIYLPINNGHDLDLDVVSTASFCSDDNGSLSVSLKKTNLAGFNEADYEIIWYQGHNLSGTEIHREVGQNGVLNYSRPGLSSGDYSVTARPLDPAIRFCEDPVVNATVDLIVEYPSIVATTINANTNCSGIMENGSLEILVDNGVRPLSDFNVTWYIGDANSTTPLPAANIVTPDELQNLAPGIYTVHVEDNTQYQTCATNRTFTIDNDPPTISVASGDVTVSNVVSCDPNNNGSEITINQILEDGIPGNISDYTFEWKDPSGTSIPSVNGPSIQDLSTLGTYSVIATNTVNNCLSTQIDFEITDETIGDPSVALIDFTNPTQCQLLTDDMGMLQVMASGTASSYSYEWFEGSDTSTPQGTTGATVSGLNPGFYTVEVTNDDTQCTTTATYELQLDIKEVTITGSGNPVTSCELENDGSAFAIVTSGNSDLYTYEWSTGDVGQEITDIRVGTYTVRAVSNNDNRCISPDLEITINQEYIYPELSVEALSAMTVCDTALADGAARALVDGSYIGYTFEWYENEDFNSDEVFTGSEFTSMKEGTYGVIATNDVTGCSTSQVVTIDGNTVPTEPVSITILAHDTHCLLDIGALSASVNGNTSNYNFLWFNGSQVSTDTAFVGEIYDSLATGFYTVQATNKSTGCISTATAEILENLEFPEFQFVVGNSTCVTSDGFARVSMVNSVGVNSIVWTDQGGDPFDSLQVIGRGSILNELDFGVYTAHVFTNQGCYQSEDVKIETDVNVLNGISRNGDGKNDFLQIDCIENYPESIVKIFNRAGTMVYETEGYDNTGNRFDGVSNKGISVMGNSLPDGTYFYIIDKKDGTKPQAGYLEIVN